MSLLELLTMKHPRYNKYSVFTVLGDGIRPGRAFSGRQHTQLMRVFLSAYNGAAGLRDQ